MTNISNTSLNDDKLFSRQIKYRAAEKVFVAVTGLLQKLQISYGFEIGFCYVIDIDSDSEIKKTLKINTNHVKILLKNEIMKSEDPILIEFRTQLNNSQINKYLNLFTENLGKAAEETYATGKYDANYKTGKNIGHIDDEIDLL